MRTLAALLVLVTNLSGQSAPSLEYDVKGAFLYNFSKFVDWPSAAFSTSRDPLKICIFGADPFGPGLERLIAGEPIGGRNSVVERPQTIELLRTCHIAFISSSERPRLNLILDGLRG